MTAPFKRESHRKEKVEGMIKQEISKIILHELKDPRCGFCTITKVKISRDLKKADVFVSVLGDDSSQRTTLRGLNSALSFIQKRLFKEIKLRYLPSITFHIDQSIERSVRISKLLRDEGVPESDGFGEAMFSDTDMESESKPENEHEITNPE